MLTDSDKAELEDTVESKHARVTIDERRSVERLKNVFVALVEQEWKNEGPKRLF